MGFKKKNILWYDGKSRLAIIAGTFFVAVLAMAALRYIPFDNDIEVMLPRQPEVLQDFRFFRESPLAKNIAVSFKLNDELGKLSDLILAVDQFTAKIQSPMITHVLSTLETQQSFQGIQEYLKLAPQLMNQEQLQALDLKLTDAFVREKVGGFYRASLLPTGAFLIPLMQLDPLGFHAQALADLRAMQSNMDYDVEIQDGHLISRDGRHALVILETNVPITDGFGAKVLVNDLRELIAALPPQVSADLIAGHLHSLSNEKVIKRDILVTSIVSSSAFLLIFLFLFRDFRALFLFTIPLISVLLSVPICALVTGKVSFVIMGMGAVIAGIANDYCIHVYIAMQSGQSRKNAVGEVAKMVAMGALTTVAVFSVFLFSKVPGYRELSVLTIVSLLLSLFFALVLLPHFLTPKQNASHRKVPRFRNSRIFNQSVIAVWGLLILGCLALLPRVHFETNVKQYDGSEAEIFDTEAAFQDQWGGGSRPAMLVVKAPDFDEALRRYHRLSAQSLVSVGDHAITSLSEIWPDQQTRLENLQRWNSFWQGSRKAQLEQLFQGVMNEYGFSKDVFAAFLNTLQLDPEEVKNFERIDLLNQLKQRFVFETKDGITLVSFFKDEKERVETLIREVDQIPHVFVVSSKRFTQILSESILSESIYMSAAITLMIFAMTFLFLKNLVLTLIALVPVVTSILFIFGAGTLLNIPLNAASMIAVLVVGGLCIDSGIFMVNDCRFDLKTNTRKAVTLSALTTVIGAGALSFAKHPVLYSYGTTMAFGIVAGYLAAMFVVPAVYGFCAPHLRLHAKCV